MQGVILAAGKGKRLRPLSNHMSKALAPVLGRPILHWLMADIIEATPIRDWIIVTSDSNQDIVDYFEKTLDGGKALHPDVSIRYVYQDKQLGTGHALKCAREEISESFLMAACDSLFPREHIAEIYQAHQERKANITLSLKRLTVAQFAETAVVGMDETGEIKSIIEKPKPEDAPSDMGSLPMYLFEPKVLEVLDEIPESPRGEYEIQPAIQMTADRHGGVYGVVTPERHSLSSVRDLLDINLHYFSHRCQRDLGQELQKQFTNVTIAPPVIIEADVNIAESAQVGPNVYIGRGSMIGAGAHVSNAYLFPDSVVNSEEMIREELLHPEIPRNPTT